MTTGYQIKDQEGLYYLTFQIVDWIDIFSRQVYRDIVIDSFKYAMENKGLQIFAYVIMSNHVHLELILELFPKHKIIGTIQSIAESRREWLLNRFQFNANQHSRNENYQVWTHENHAIYLYSPEFIAEKLEYLHQNPAGWNMVMLIAINLPFRTMSIRTLVDTNPMLLEGVVLILIMITLMLLMNILIVVTRG